MHEAWTVLTHKWTASEGIRLLDSCGIGQDLHPKQASIGNSLGKMMHKILGTTGQIAPVATIRLGARLQRSRSGSNFQVKEDNHHEFERLWGGLAPVPHTICFCCASRLLIYIACIATAIHNSVYTRCLSLPEWLSTGPLSTCRRYGVSTSGIQFSASIRAKLLIRAQRRDLYSDFWSGPRLRKIKL